MMEKVPATHVAPGRGRKSLSSPSFLHRKGARHGCAFETTRSRRGRRNDECTGRTAGATTRAACPWCATGPGKPSRAARIAVAPAGCWWPAPCAEYKWWRGPASAERRFRPASAERRWWSATAKWRRHRPASTGRRLSWWWWLSWRRPAALGRTGRPFEWPIARRAAANRTGSRCGACAGTSSRTG